MNDLIQIFRDYFDEHLQAMRFVDAGKALKSLVIFLNDAGELEVNQAEINEKVVSLQIKIPLMNFEEVEKVSGILLYVKRRIASLSSGPIYGSGLAREPTPEETARILSLRGTNGNSLGSVAEPGPEADSFVSDLRDDDSGDE